MEEPKDENAVSSSTYWKALAHPLRCGILSLLANRAMTNEEMAKSLGVESGALYFHTKHLLTAKMIEPAGTRQKGSITEKLYQAVSNQFLAPKPSTSGPEAPFDEMLSSALELYRTTWQYDRKQVERLQLGYQVVVMVPPSTVTQIAAQLKAIMERLRDENGTDPAGIPIAMSTLMHSVSPEVFGGKSGVRERQ